MSFLKPNEKYNASLTVDYTAGDATLGVSAIPANFPTIVTVARGTVKETRFTVTGASPGLLTGVTRLDGASANISAGVSVECMIDTEFITQLSAAVFDQAGLKGLVYAADGGNSDAYAITLPIVPTAYTDIVGLPIAFKANTANTGPATLNINSLGAKTIKKRNDQDLLDNDIAAEQIVTVVYDGTNFQMQSQVANAPTASILTTSSFAPQGFLLNGKIAVTVSSSNITVAIKGMDGNNPSGSNPVYCRIGDTVRTITSALSVTKNAGTNWFNGGSAELATNEIDYFVYLGYNATDGVTIGFARVPYGNKYGDFSATTTNQAYCAISTITTAASTDYYELVGRFAATLSAGAGYTWTVPTFTAANLIQRPIYASRYLTWTPTYTTSATAFTNAPTTNVAKYQITDRRVHVINRLSYHASSSGGTGDTRVSIPFTEDATYYQGFGDNPAGGHSLRVEGQSGYFGLAKYDNTTNIVDNNSASWEAFYLI